MKKLIGVLLLFRAIVTVLILLILLMVFNATGEHLQNAREHLSNAGDELGTLAGDLEDAGQNVSGVFLAVADSANTISGFLSNLPNIPGIDSSLEIEIPAGTIRDALANFRIPTSLTSSVSLLSIIENNFSIEVPFASSFNTFRTQFNSMVTNLEASFDDIELMGEALDTVSDELQLANNDLVAAATALDNLPGGLGTYLPSLILGFIVLWFITAILMDLQRGFELLTQKPNADPRNE